MTKWNPTSYAPDDFANLRHIGPSSADVAEMLKAVGAPTLDALIEQTVPAAIRQKNRLDWPALSEAQLHAKMRGIAGRNKIMTSMIGQGYYGTVTPPVILRNVFENPAWYTAYTPYQPEIAQGRLEALLNFQTTVIDLTGLPIANASLLDEATAAAEAMAMAQRLSKNKSKSFFVDTNLHPQTISVIETRAAPMGFELIKGTPDELDASKVFGAIFSYPGTHGQVRDLTAECAALHDAGGIAVVATDLLALCVLKEPAAMGADIAVGSAQRFGVPMGYGGPHAGFMSCKDDAKRVMPGRIVGVSIDSSGNKAYRLALQTREQHIRREKATSNVCTAQALLANMASFYAVFHGPEGLRAIAQRVHLHAVTLANALRASGAEVETEHFFDTITVRVGDKQEAILSAARDNGINLRQIDGDRIGISTDEITNDDIIARVLKAFGVTAAAEAATAPAIPDALLRESEYLTHPTFNMSRSETELMRYMRRLADRDLALDRAMIPLGSCTMKLNAAAEMIPVSWPEFGSLHPYVPQDQAAGYHEIFADLSEKLCEITGYDAFSLQPNSGAQGEYAGLMTIAAYHRSRGDERDICLIPMSAHGTNPATAQMCGMKVVVVKSAPNGDIDVEDFREKAAKAGNRLAAVMVTYPSTHGVFEDTIRDVCDITHEHGGQVYIDGANMNALSGLVRPGDVGGDVSHLNLHKTFAIPHGGGGPGMGPIGVKAHLAPFLPGDPREGKGAVNAANWGSASILLISWAYIRLMGGEGVTEATRIAILNANYVASRLAGAYPILFMGNRGRVAHECILDTRPFTEHGVSVDDIAKRLIDNGFHPPTMSFPVSGTLMVEPTESESKEEIDRFIDALLAIREEITDVAEGRIAIDDSPLRHAPHTIADMVGEWDRSYSREQGGFPAGAPRDSKYWPAVGRIDHMHGDKNLVCSCPPLEDYLEAAE